MMSCTQRAVREPASYRNDLDICVVIANIVAYLLQAPKNGKISNRIGEHDFAAQRHASSYASHVLLGNSGIHKTIRKSFGKRLDDPKTEVPHYQVDPLIALRQFYQRAVESTPH